MNSSNNNNNNDKVSSRPFKNFRGTVDQLLEHCSKIDLNQLGNEDVILQDDEMIDIVIEDMHVSRSEAEKIVYNIKLQCVMETIEKLINDGLAEIKGYGDDGEPLYGLTALGEELAETLKKNDNNNNNT